jgi:hypothetical protein
MEERDDALDFIYKGWREGRQQRRDFANQRGADRIAARRQRMARYGSPSMAIQRDPSKPKGGPPSRKNVASSPPSSSWVNPVQQVIARNNAASSFSDDIKTPGDESTSQNEAAPAPVQEVVSTPPMNTETAMATMDRFMGGTGATRSTYDPTSPKPTQANVPQAPERMEMPDPRGLVHDPTETSTENLSAPMTLDEAKGRLTPKPEAEKTEPQRRNLGEAGEIIDGNIPYNLDGQRIPERSAPTGMGEGEYKETRPTVQPAKDLEPPKERYKAPEMPYKRESVSGYQLRPIKRNLKPDGGLGEPVPEKTATLTPVKQLKPVEQQHKESFETAYEEMKNEATQPEIPDEIDFSRDSKPAKEVVEETKETPDPKPAKAVVEATKPKKQNGDFMDSAEDEPPKAPYVQIGNQYVSQGTAGKMVRDGTHKWGRKTPDGRATLQEVKAKKKTTAKKPAKAEDPVVQAAAKQVEKPAAKKTTAKKKPKATDEKPDPIKPKGKATNEGKKRASRASDELAGVGMGDAPSKKKTNRETQDLKRITKPDDLELRRSADQQMLADVLLKKLPVADLRMFGRATGIEDIAPLLDDKGFMTQVVGVDPAHVVMMGVSDKPDFDLSTKPAIGFDLGKLKFNNSYPGFPPNRKPMIEDLITPPTKAVNVLDDEGKPIEIGRTKPTRKLSEGTWVLQDERPIYQTEMVEDEDIGFFIRDGNKQRRMTRAEAKEILSQRAAGSPFKGAGKLDFATPYFDTKQHVWRLPIIQGKGSPKELPRSPWKNFSFVETRPLDSKVGLYPQTFPQLDLKEIAAFTPKELKERFKGLNPKENVFTRIGESRYPTNYLKDLVSGMTPSNMAEEDIRFFSKRNHPLLSEGRGVVRYDEDPSYWRHFLAPNMDDVEENPWQSMNDLFE